MTSPVMIHFRAVEPEEIAGFEGRIVVFVPADAALGPLARRVDRAMRGALARFVASEAFGGLKAGEAVDLAWPAGLKAEAVQVIRLETRANVAEARKAGGAIGKSKGTARVLVLAGPLHRAAQVSLGVALRDYDFTEHKTSAPKPRGDVTFMVSNPEAVAAEAGPLASVAEGVFFTRDLVNEPANILTTDDFAARLAAMHELGLDVEILEEPELKALGMGALLGVGQGSASPSKVVVMQWNGGAAGDAPFALVGKGVVFDTGGISIKPAGGMEEMTMDMGGAGVVAGVMRTLALRKAKANVVGLVGIVENMPDGLAQRPGDVVKSMKGDTIEVINTDAEGRLVLADVLWYAQERFKPRGMIDLATLTGAIIVALGHENTGVFSNDDALCAAFLKACAAEGEGAWRMPMGEAYDFKLKSRIADMMNVGGRDGGAITAAQFLKRFVKPETPWCHLDIAGTALVKNDLDLSPKGRNGLGGQIARPVDPRPLRRLMGAVYFYHLTRSPLEAALAMLLERSLAQGWRVAVRGTSDEGLRKLDAALWVQSEETFLAHGLAGGSYDADQPVLLTRNGDAPNAPACVMSVGGAAIEAAEVAALERACILFDGNDEAAVAHARGQWKALTESGASAQYWSEESGRWEKKAER